MSLLYRRIDVRLFVIEVDVALLIAFDQPVDYTDVELRLNEVR